MDARVTRREFVQAGAGIAAVSLLAPALRAQEATAQGAANIEMPQSAYKPVSLPPKAGAKPLLNAAQRDELERGLKCACPCKLDVFTCRTTDFQCGISPAMHSDVVRLVDGGHTADEIVAAFTKVYGERVLMAPVKEGFNIAGYVVPFLSVAAGGSVLLLLLQRWKRESSHPAAAAAQVLPMQMPDATPDELARLNAAVHGKTDR